MGAPTTTSPTAGGEEARARRIRRLHRLSVGAAIVVVALTAVSMVSRPTPCGSLPSSYPPIIAFELARSADDLYAIFGPAGAPCASKLGKQLDTINVVDVAVFIPAYGLFLLTAFAGLALRRRPLAPAGVVLTMVAVLADVAENVCLLGLTPDLDAGSPWMKLLPWATAAKWLALGAAGAVAGLALWHGPRRHHRVTAVLCMLTPLAVVAALADPHRFGPVIATGVAVSWIMLLVDGVAQARRRP